MASASHAPTVLCHGKRCLYTWIRSTLPNRLTSLAHTSQSYRRAANVNQSQRRTLHTVTTPESQSTRATDHAPSLDMLSEEELFVKKRVAKFAKEVIAPHVREMDDTCVMKPEIIQGLFDNGLMGVEIAREYGGPEASFFMLILALEELAKVDMSVSILVDVQNTISDALLRTHGTEAQKQKYLTKLATDMITGFCMSERQSGSDAFSLHTQATRQGSSYIIHGSKLWISNAEHAGLFHVMANADPSEGYRGITCFLVPRDAPGVSIGRRKDKLGIRASSTCPVFFDHVEVPEDSVLGEVGEGYRYAINVINAGRIGLSAQMVGLAQGCLDKTLPYIRQDKEFGQPLWNFQAIQHQVALVSSQIMAARLMVYNAARRKMNGLPYVKEAAMAKHFSAEVAHMTTSRCVEWTGTAGVVKNNCIEKYYRDCKIGAIYEGTGNMQLSTIAKYIDHEQLYSDVD